MNRRMSACILVTAGLILAAACDDDVTGPSFTPQVIALSAVDGTPPPATVEEAPGYLRTWIADTIRIEADGRWTRRQILEFTTPTAGPTALDWASDGTVERFEGELVLSFECNDTASCVAPDRLVPQPYGYSIEWPTGDEILIFRYGIVSEG